MAKNTGNDIAKAAPDAPHVIVIARTGDAPGVLATLRAFVGDRLSVIDPAHVGAGRPWAPTTASAPTLLISVVPLDQPEMEAAVHALSRQGGSVLYACVARASLGLAQVLLRLGAAELFELGPDGSAAGLGEAVRRHLQNSVKTRARLHAVMALRGGVGATTVASEYAFRAARQVNAPDICLLDLDVGLGRAAERLGAPALWRPNAETPLDDARSRHWSGLHIVSAPFLPSARPLTETALETLEALITTSDEIVVDVPRSWPDIRHHVLAKADIVTLVSDPSATGLDVARRANLALDTWFPDAKDVFLLVNRRRLPRDKHVGDNRLAETALGYDRVMVLDEDRDAFQRASGLREPVHYVAPASPFVRSFSIYADAVRAAHQAGRTSSLRKAG